MDHGDLWKMSGRRSFLKTVLPGSLMMCLGGRCLLASPLSQEKTGAAEQKHKFLDDSGMSFRDVFRAANLNHLSLFRGIEKEMGSEKFTALVKRIIDENARRDMAEFARSLGKNDLTTFTQYLRQPNRFWKTVLTYQILVDAPQAFEVKVTECLWAKTYLEAGAADLGFVFHCYGDFASAEGFNPKMRMTRTKTLMQGHDCCNHRYVIEA